MACATCLAQLETYLAAKDWSDSPMRENCSLCLGWSVDRLIRDKYVESYTRPHTLGDDAPGAHLFDQPGLLTSALLLDAWSYCIDMFAHKNERLEGDVNEYFKQLCINDETIEIFITQCRRYVRLREVRTKPQEYQPNEIAAIIRDAALHPTNYQVPSPPAMWLLSSIDEKVEGAMHLSMGIQKAAFKLTIAWATEAKKGSALQRRLADNLQSLKQQKLGYCPARPYKDEKFGGYTAENYRALTMTSPYLYRSLLEIDLQPPPPRVANTLPQKEWTRKDNVNWMYVRAIFHAKSITAPEAREEVRRAMLQSQPPPIVNDLPEPINTQHKMFVT